MKTIITTLILSASSLFALHPISDYKECQQPYIEDLRNGDSEAFKNSIVKCKARLWNEDMQYYSSFNYNKFSDTSLSCSGDLQAMEVLKRSSKRSLKVAATFYRLAANKNNQDAKINLVYLKEKGNKVIFLDDTEEKYTKVFTKNKDSKTFIQIFSDMKDVPREGRKEYMEKYKKQLVDYTASCVVSLEKDVLTLQEEYDELNESFAEVSNVKDKELEESIHAWANIEERVIKAELNMMKKSLKKFTGMNKKISRK